MNALEAAASEHDGLRCAGAALPSLKSERVAARLGGRRVEFTDWGYYPPQFWRNYSHVHSFYEFCYAYAGRGVFRTGDAEHPVGPGDVFVARPGDVHEIVSDEDDPLGIVYWSWVLLPVRGGSPAAETGALLDAFAAGERRIAPAGDGPLPRTLALLAREAAEPGPASGGFVDALAATVALAAARALADPLPAPAPRAESGGPDRGESTVATMVRYLHDNYHRPVVMRDVAAQVHLSERHAARLFRTVTGSTVHAFLTRVRMESAAQRLCDPVHRSTPIAAIARSCGYPDPRNFGSAFHRYWGATPTAVRTRGGTTQLTAA